MNIVNECLTFNIVKKYIKEKRSECEYRKNQRYKRNTGKKGYTQKRIEQRVKYLCEKEYGSVENAKKDIPFAKKTREFRKRVSKRKKSFVTKAPFTAKEREIKSGQKYIGAYAKQKDWDKELIKEKIKLKKRYTIAKQSTINMWAVRNIEKQRYRHDSGAKAKHRMAVEALIDELRSRGHNVIPNPEFAPHKPDLIDQTTNTRYEIQTNLYMLKQKQLPKNTKIIPIKYAPSYKEEMRDYLKKYVVKGHKDK